jgi:hypothetical protein
LEPESRAGHKTWQEAHAGNVRDAMMARNTDIVLLGDSIIEGWRGMSLGQLIPEKKPNIKVFDSHFDETATVPSFKAWLWDWPGTKRTTCCGEYKTVNYHPTCNLQYGG